MSSGPAPSAAGFRSRFVTACQQLLVLAVVCAGLTPALGVVSLDVVATPSDGASGQVGALLSAYGEEAQKTSRLPSGPVQAKVDEVALTQPSSGKLSGRSVGRIPALTANARVVAAPGGGTRLTSVPQRVTGYGSVGVTWQHGIVVPDTELS